MFSSLTLNRWLIAWFEHESECWNNVFKFKYIQTTKPKMKSVIALEYHTYSIFAIGVLYCFTKKMPNLKDSSCKCKQNQVTTSLSFVVFPPAGVILRSHGKTLEVRNSKNVTKRGFIDYVYSDLRIEYWNMPVFSSISLHLADKWQKYIQDSHKHHDSF